MLDRLVLKSRLALGTKVERLFDRLNRVDTCGQLSVRQLGISGPASAAVYGFASTPIRTLRHVLRTLPVAHRDLTFIDYGCGKGRALLIAARFPFRRIIGIEHAGELVSVSRANLLAFRGRHASTEIEVLHADAASFSPPPGEGCLIYLFNPFTEPLLRQAIGALVSAHAVGGRRMLLCFAQQVSPLAAHVDPGALNRALRRVHLPPLPFDWLAHPQIDISLFEVDLAV